MSFSRIPHLRIFCSCCLVVEGTVDGKDDKEEETREVVVVVVVVVMVVDIKDFFDFEHN